MTGFLRTIPYRTYDVHMVVCPLYHSSGSGFATIAQALGNTMRDRREVLAGGVLRARRTHQVTTTTVVPTMLHQLAAWPEAKRLRPVEPARRRVHGFAAARGGAGRGARAAGQRDLRPVRLDGDGIRVDRDARRPAAQARNRREAVVRDRRAITDPEGDRVPRGRARRGVGRALRSAWRATWTIPSSTPSVCATARSPSATSAIIDEDGYLHIVDRADDMIISGGVNVYPAETEIALNAHPNVDEATVLGVADPKWGERIVAAVVPAGEVTEDELIAWAKDNAAYAAVPKEVRFMDALPRNDIGKIDKKAIARGLGVGVTTREGGWSPTGAPSARRSTAFWRRSTTPDGRPRRPPSAGTCATRSAISPTPTTSCSSRVTGGARSLMTDVVEATGELRTPARTASTSSRRGRWTASARSRGRTSTRGGGRRRARLPTRSRPRPEPDGTLWGPNKISPLSLVSARMMETWAHSLDVHDAAGVPYVDTDRLRHIAFLGLRALRYAFTLEGLDAPGPIRLELDLAVRRDVDLRPRRRADRRSAGRASDWCRVVARRDRDGCGRTLERQKARTPRTPSSTAARSLMTSDPARDVRVLVPGVDRRDLPARARNARHARGVRRRSSMRSRSTCRSGATPQEIDDRSLARRGARGLPLHDESEPAHHALAHGSWTSPTSSSEFVDAVPTTGRPPRSGALPDAAEHEVRRRRDRLVRRRSRSRTALRLRAAPRVVHDAASARGATAARDRSVSERRPLRSRRRTRSAVTSRTSGSTATSTHQTICASAPSSSDRIDGRTSTCTSRTRTTPTR